MEIIDPKRLIREVKLDVWASPAGIWPDLAKSGASAAGKAAKQTLTLTAKEGVIDHDVLLCEAPAPAKVYWVQPYLIMTSSRDSLVRTRGGVLGGRCTASRARERR